MNFLVKNIDEFVEHFYSEFFEKNEEIRLIFRNTDLKPQKEELKKGLLLVVEIYDKKDELNEFLRALGVRHLAYAVSASEYIDVKECLINSYKHISGNEWNSTVEQEAEEIISYICLQMQLGAIEVNDSYNSKLG